MYDIGEHPEWRKSSRSAGDNCLEVTFANGGVLVRDSKAPQGPVLSFSASNWSNFVELVRGDLTSSRGAEVG